MTKLDPQTLNSLIDSKTVRLVDVREPDEFRRERIAGSVSMPLSGFDARRLVVGEEGQRVVLVCASGPRAADAQRRLASSGVFSVDILEGGLAAWKRAGFATQGDSRAPLPIMRQVQIAAGTLALAGFILGMMVTPAWHLLSGLVGAGLLLAGLTGFCGMANLLAFMPWNRKAGHSPGENALAR